MKPIIEAYDSTGSLNVVVAELAALRVELPHVTGSLVASIDGLLVAADIPAFQPEVLAAMSAALLGLGQQLVTVAPAGTLREAVITGTDGYLATFAAGEHALLTVLATAELNVARLHHAARPAAARIGALITPTDRF